MKDLKRGTAIVIENQFELKDKRLVDPISAKITIVDSAGTAVVTDGDMIKSSIGVYLYTWQSTSVSVLGYYHVYVEAVSGSYTVQDNWVAFRLED